MEPGLVLGRRHCQEMLDHVERHAPLEACGLLAGRGDRVERVLPVRNRVESPVRFVMDPREQVEAFLWIESNGMELLGIFHSHPAGPASASARDIVEAAYDVVHVIWSRSKAGWRARGFRIADGTAREVALKVVD